MKNILILFLLPLWLIPTGSKAQDWAQLNQFKEANSTLKPPDKDETRVVFMGNSITIGWLNTVPGFFEGKSYINRGISGQTTPQMLLRFRQDVIALQPKVVIILAGTNDIAGNTGPTSLEQILDNLKSMAELARANNIRVILCSVLPAADYPWSPGHQPDVLIPALNKLIREYAEKSGIIYLNYFDALTNGKNGMNPDLAKDGVHPTKKGYEIMAPRAVSANGAIIS